MSSMILTKFICRCKIVGIKDLNDSNVFIECSNTMDDVYENIDDCNPNRQRKILIVFDDTIADIMSNKKFQAIIKELFVRCRKLNISLDFITQSFFCSKRCEIKFNTLFDYEKYKKIYREIQNIAINHSPDIDYKDFVKIYRECTNKTFFFDN